jgi:hypothetical protein
MACLFSSWPSFWRSAFSRRSRDVTIRGEWSPIAGCLLSGSWPCCLGLSWPGWGHRI